MCTLDDMWKFYNYYTYVYEKLFLTYFPSKIHNSSSVQHVWLKRLKTRQMTNYFLFEWQQSAWMELVMIMTSSDFFFFSFFFAHLLLQSVSKKYSKMHLEHVIMVTNWLNDYNEILPFQLMAMLKQKNTKPQSI